LKRFGWAFWLLALVLAQAPVHASDLQVRACGGANEWPPSSYFTRRDGRLTTEVTGYSPDVLAAALQGSRFQPQVTLLPFARCLAEARAGHDMQIVMAAFHNPQRV
jgi:polar amino acid transport system substrate-binding protein